MIPTFTILIGSNCRTTLVDTLDSIAKQARVPGDQCLVGIDALDKSPELICATIEVVSSYGPGFLAVPYVGIADEHKIIPAAYTPEKVDKHIAPGDPYHWLGVEQINHLLRQGLVTGSHVFTIGDDDVFVDGAYETLRPICAMDPWRPILYRFVSPWRAILWDVPRFRSCFISGCCIAAPKRFVGLHPTDIETTHDFRWMQDILTAADGTQTDENGQLIVRKPLYLDYIGVVARPNEGTPVDWPAVTYRPRVVEAVE